MEKRPFFVTMFIANALFIMLHMHKSSTITGLNYAKKSYAQEFMQLCQHEQACKQELCELHNKNTVTRYAEKYLNMAQVTEDQIKRLKAFPTTSCT